MCCGCSPKKTKGIFNDLGKCADIYIFLKHYKCLKTLCILILVRHKSVNKSGSKKSDFYSFFCSLQNNYNVIITPKKIKNNFPMTFNIQSILKLQLGVPAVVQW